MFPTMQDWRHRLAGVIEERDLDMKNVSISAGLSETQVRDWLKRGREPGVSSLAAVARVLGLTLSELYEGEEGAPQSVHPLGLANGSLPPIHTCGSLAKSKGDQAGMIICDINSRPSANRSGRISAFPIC